MDIDACSLRVSPRGLFSIYVYGLNRLGLVQERSALITRLEYLLAVVERALVVKSQIDGRLEETTPVGSGVR